MDNANVPAPVATGALARLQDAVDCGMAPALAIMLDESLFAQVQKIAGIMAKADGFVPRHCVGRTEVCFAIVTRALVWRLDPFAVAQSTYQPVDGAKVSYEAKLVQAVLEQSGRLDGPITREYRGDWTKVHGKFRMQTSEKSQKRYAVAAWAEEAEIGLGITVSAKLKGERDARSVDLDLRQCHPRNSTLWATDPVTQIYYRAVRMLGNLAMPGVLMGVPFVGEVDDDEDSRAGRARNVTPVVDTQARASAPPPEDVLLIDPDGEEIALLPGEVEARVQGWCEESTDEQLAALVESNSDNEIVRRMAEMEQGTRSAEAKRKADDPLNLLGLKGAMAFMTTLRLGLEQASAVDADRYWALYQEKAQSAEEKLKAGEYASLEQLVAAKIEGRAS